MYYHPIYYREEMTKNLTILTIYLYYLSSVCRSPSLPSFFPSIYLYCLYLCHSPSSPLSFHLSLFIYVSFSLPLSLPPSFFPSIYICGILPPLPHLSFHLSVFIYVSFSFHLSLPPIFLSVYLSILSIFCGVLPPLPHLSFHLLVFSLVRRSRSRSRDSADEGEPIQERFFRPHFLQAPGDLTVQEGRLCRMDCKVRGVGASLLPAIPLPSSSFWGKYVKYTSLKCFLAEEERKWNILNIYIHFKSFFSLTSKFLLNMSFT